MLLRSAQKAPVSPGGDSASHTMVSAPSAGVCEIIQARVSIRGRGGGAVRGTEFEKSWDPSSNVARGTFQAAKS